MCARNVVPDRGLPMIRSGVGAARFGMFGERESTTVLDACRHFRGETSARGKSVNRISAVRLYDDPANPSLAVEVPEERRDRRRPPASAEPVGCVPVVLSPKRHGCLPSRIVVAILRCACSLGCSEPDRDRLSHASLHLHQDSKDRGNQHRDQPLPGTAAARTSSRRSRSPTNRFAASWVSPHRTTSVRAMRPTGPFSAVPSGARCCGRLLASSCSALAWFPSACTKAWPTIAARATCASRTSITT